MTWRVSFVIQCTLNPRFMCYMAPYDVASDINRSLCGGTLIERAKRLFAVKAVDGDLSLLDPSMFAKTDASTGQGGKNNKRNRVGGGGGGEGEPGTDDTEYRGGRPLVAIKGPLLPGHERRKRKQ